MVGGYTITLSVNNIKITYCHVSPNYIVKENDIVICQPEEMDVRGYDIVDDANAMVDYINKFTSEDVQLEHIKRLERTKEHGF